MNWALLISKIIEKTTKNIINNEATTVSYFMKYLDEKSEFNKSFKSFMDNTNSFNEFREGFHKLLRQIDALGDAHLDMTLHGFLNQDIFPLEEAINFAYWLNENHPKCNDIKEAIDVFFWDFDIIDEETKNKKNKEK